MEKITEATRRNLYDVIQECFSITDDELHENKMQYCGNLNCFEFLSRLYNLENMPSTDVRYKSAKGDIYCHTVSFHDWSDFWFLEDERFELTDGNEDEPILNFICGIFHPAVRDEESSWRAYLAKFNELLKPDGYEIYASYRISGRDIFKVKEYVAQKSLFVDSQLFTTRYKELIQVGNGELIDNICGEIDPQVKKHLVSVMTEFAEPAKVKPNRYDNYEITTDALRLAIGRFINVIGYPAIELHRDNMFGTSYKDQLIQLFNPYLFDIIELQHDVLSLSEKISFRTSINSVLSRGNVYFILSESGMVEQQILHEVLDDNTGENIGKILEPGLRELMDEAIALHQQANISAHRIAVEKIWDALERLKTYYTCLDKKASANKIINDISGGQADFSSLFTSEFRSLTDIGNKFRIRHHETDKIDIIDTHYYDYFFNRCLSLIALAIQYLK